MSSLGLQAKTEKGQKAPEPRLYSLDQAVDELGLPADSP